MFIMLKTLNCAKTMYNCRIDGINTNDNYMDFLTT